MKQKYLGKIGLFLFLAILTMVAPLSTDLYLPALPSISTDLNTSATFTGLTLVVFNIFLAIGVLFFGFVSDKHGRKKPLMVSLIVYGLGSFVCCVSINIWILILGRCIQAFGAGGMMSIPLAVVKDFYRGPNRGKILAILQSFTILAPIFAPLLGAFILSWSTWRMCFIVLVVFSLINIVFCVLYQDTIPKDEIINDKLSVCFKRVFVIAKNKAFMLLLLVCSLFMACFFAYLASVSYVYEDYFHLTQTEFSMYFAINASVSILGSVVCVLIGRKVKLKPVMRFMFTISTIAIILMCTVGQKAAPMFLISFVIFGASNTFLRPYATNLMLDMHDGDTGSASGLINFVFTILGAFGMYIGTLPWPNYVLGIAFTMIILLFTALVLWLFVRFSKIIK